MPLVYTTTEGGNPNIVELSTPSQNVQRPLVQDLTTDIVRNVSGLPGASLSQALLDIVAATVPRATVIREFGYAAGAPLVQEMLPAGHPLAMYLICNWCLVRVAGGGTSALARSQQLSVPVLGAYNLTGFANLSLTIAPSNSVFNALVLVSDGALPLQTTWTPITVSGAPVVDVYAAAIKLGEL